MRTLLSVTVLSMACTSAPAASPADAAVGDVAPTPDAAPDATPDATHDAGPRALASQRCSAPAPWAEPLRDYLAAGEAQTHGRAFLRAVQDLAVYQDRLYVGYGDANLNLGRVTPIEVRAFTDDSRTDVTTEFRTDEEQIEQYRALDGDLWIAGVDATEDAWLGNVYGRDRTTNHWTKWRTVNEGVHVHDVAWWRGALWAVGSGSAEADWTRGDIYGHLWRSDDRGRTFTTAARHFNMTMGDARWVRILALPDAMLLFGYRSDSAGRTTIVNARWNGTSAEPLPMDHPLRAAFGLETLSLPDGGGIVRVAIREETVGLVHRVFRVRPDGTATRVAGLVGRRVLDATVHAPTGEVLLVSSDVDEYPGDTVLWSMRLDVTRDFETFTTLASFDADVAMRSVAAWRGRVYLGADDGAVWRCDLADP